MINFFLGNTKKYFLIIALINVLSGLTVPLNIFLIQRIIDTAVVSGKSGFGNDFTYILFYLGLQIVTVLLTQSDKLLRTIFGNTLEINWGKDILEKSAKVQYKYFEQTKSYETIHRILGGFKENITGITDITSSVTKITISMFGVFYFIMQTEWWIFIALLITAFPVWLFSIISTLRERDTYSEIYPHFLRANYLSKMINSRESIKEVRLYNFFKHINKLWSEVLSKFQRGQLLSNLKPRYIAGAFIFLQYFVVTVIIFMLVYPLRKGLMTIGVFVALSQAMWNYVGNFQYEIINIIQKINHLRVFAKDYKTFMALDENSSALCGGDANNINFTSIEFKDVWFRYDGSSEYVLKGVNFSIANNELIALVGLNGSGKTTIIKLLLGLLHPTKGEVLVDGMPVSDIQVTKRKKIFSVIFQDFAKYNISLRENIALSNLDFINNEKEMIRILNSLTNQAELVQNLKDGFDTRLGKDIDGGTDLSGGQWQTVAIARALFSDSSCIVMDEPTAAIDPIAEVEVYNQLISAAKNKAAVFVTHRLGSTRLAHTIYTLDKGIIVEKGSHEELMERNGIYAEMFNTQKRWYEK